jgi:hypothetical protein
MAGAPGWEGVADYPLDWANRHVGAPAETAEPARGLTPAPSRTCGCSARPPSARVRPACLGDGVVPPSRLRWCHPPPPTTAASLRFPPRKARSPRRVDDGPPRATRREWCFRVNSMFADTLRPTPVPHALLAVQKVEGSNLFSRFAKGSIRRSSLWKQSAGAPASPDGHTAGPDSTVSFPVPRCRRVRLAGADAARAGGGTSRQVCGKPCAGGS